MTVARAICTLAALVLLLGASTTVSAQNNPAADRDRGIELYRQGKYAEASKLLKNVVKKAKTDDTAWYYLGLSLMRKKELKDAIKALETAVQLQPKSASAHLALGYALLMRNQNAVALHEGLAAQAIDPRLADAHYISGVAYLRLGTRDSALQEAEAVLKIDPKFANAYLLKSQALVSFIGDAVIRDKTDEPIQGRYTQAGDALEKYIELNQNAEDKETLREQLETLRFFEAQQKRSNRVAYNSREVGTKARVISKPEPVYTERARADQVIGTVVLRAIFADDGRVKHIIVVRGLPDGLTEMALSAARRIRFVPATINGLAVSTYIQLEYNFNLY